MPNTEEVQEGLIISRRKVLPIGGSKAVTLSKKWLDIQRWLGREVDELISVSNSIIILVDPEKKDEAVRFIRLWEEQVKAGGLLEAKT